MTCDELRQALGRIAAELELEVEVVSEAGFGTRKLVPVTDIDVLVATDRGVARIKTLGT
jgi:hypothetical protein